MARWATTRATSQSRAAEHHSWQRIRMGLALGMLLSSRGVCVAAALVCSEAHAWILPEHAQITAEATSELPESERAVLQALWSATRKASAAHLCSGLGRAPATAGGAVTCLGFADLPSVAGDH